MKIERNEFVARATDRRPTPSIRVLHTYVQLRMCIYSIGWARLNISYFIGFLVAQVDIKDGQHVIETN